MKLAIHAYLLCAVPLALCALVSPGTGQAAAPPEEFDEAQLFFELNDTDEDLGLHGFVDGGPYRILKLRAPKGSLLNLSAKGGLKQQGLTELFFESDEPSFDELTPEEFFERFPAGTYTFQAKGLESGEKFESEVELSQVLAAPAGNVTVDGAAAAANCDAMTLPTGTEPVVIDWDPVTSSHPTIGETGAVTIAQYQFFVETLDESVVFGGTLPPTQTSFTIPPEITAIGGTFKYEIIARTDTGNNTATESCYTVP